MLPASYKKVSAHQNRQNTEQSLAVRTSYSPQGLKTPLRARNPRGLAHRPYWREKPRREARGMWRALPTGRDLRVCAGVIRPRRLPRRLGVDAGDDTALAVPVPRKGRLAPLSPPAFPLPTAQTPRPDTAPPPPARCCWGRAATYGARRGLQRT